MVTFWFVKKAAVESNNLYLIIAMAIYTFVMYSFYRILRQGKNLATVNVLWNVASCLYGLAIGILIFQEKISNLEILGSLLATIGIFLILYKP